jgi:DegV family protein with EDD domain
MIRIVTDSSSYFKKQEALDLGVRVVPISYMWGSQIFLESYSDCNGDFERLFESGVNLTTSQPNISAFLSCFEELLSQGEDVEVLCIVISSRLSGTYSSAHAAASQVTGGRVAVFDSQATAGGLYLLILEAKRLIDEGKTLSEIMEELERIRDRITVAFSVDDMEPLRKSGRIGFVRMGVSTIMNIKPILLCKDGAVVFERVTRGNSELIRRLTEMLSGGTAAAVINYIENSRTAVRLYDAVREKFPLLPVKLLRMGPVLGVHLGLKVIGLSYISKE